MITPLHRNTLGLRLANTLIAAAAIAFVTTLGAQESLQKASEVAGTDWIIGCWTAETADGQIISCEFKWELDGHASTITFKMNDYVHHGMVYRAADKNQVIEVGADNKGGRVEGIWTLEGETLVSRTTRVLPDGQTMRCANYHSRVDDATMKAAFHLVDETGEVVQEPWATLVFNRKTEPASSDHKSASP
jgi:long-subunit fatty acid transport protein